MADIVSSLFGLSPMQEEAELTSRQRNYDLGNLIGQAGTTGFMTPTQSQNYINRNAAQAALAGTAVRGLGSLFGLQDPQLQRASSLEGILQSTQQELGEQANDPSVFYPQLQRKLAEGGYSREAFQVGQVGQKSMQDSALSQLTTAEKLSTINKNNAEAESKRKEAKYKVGSDIGKIQADIRYYESIEDPESVAALKTELANKLKEKGISISEEMDAAIYEDFKKQYKGNAAQAARAFRNMTQQEKLAQAYASKDTSLANAITLMTKQAEEKQKENAIRSIDSRVNRDLVTDKLLEKYPQLKDQINTVVTDYINTQKNFIRKNYSELDADLEAEKQLESRIKTDPGFFGLFKSQTYEREPVRPSGSFLGKQITSGKFKGQYPVYMNNKLVGYDTEGPK